jgi:hypothetical protein
MLFDLGKLGKDSLFREKGLNSCFALTVEGVLGGAEKTAGGAELVGEVGGFIDGFGVGVDGRDVFGVGDVDFVRGYADYWA